MVRLRFCLRCVWRTINPDRPKIVIAFLASTALLGAAVYGWWRAGAPVNPLTASAHSSAVVVFDPAAPFTLDPPQPGWRHRKFWFTPPMQLSFSNVEGVAALRCETNAGGSIYGRNIDIDLARFPLLVWRWRVEVPIPARYDERERSGDDHPVRFYLEFRDSDDAAHRAEIIWSNSAFTRGDYKYIGTFPHYVADGGDANIGRWRDESADLEAIYRHITKRADAARLTYLAVFCDSDNTKTRSVAYTAQTILKAR